MPVGISRMALVVALISSFAGEVAFISRQAGRDARGDSAEKDPAALLARAKEVMRLARAGESVMQYRAVAASEQNYQSDRTYPPFFSAMEAKETGAEHLPLTLWTKIEDLQKKD